MKKLFQQTVTKISKRFVQLTVIIFILTVFLPTSFSFGQSPKVCISRFKKDSLRVFVKDIIKKPLVKICNLKGGKIISYNLTLNINGVIYEWTGLKNCTLDNDKIQKLLEVKSDMPKNNQLFIENVKYLKPDNSVTTADGLFLWLTSGQTTKK